MPDKDRAVAITIDLFKRKPRKKSRQEFPAHLAIIYASCG